MYKNNRRDSSKLKVCCPLQYSYNLIGIKPQSATIFILTVVGYFILKARITTQSTRPKTRPRFWSLEFIKRFWRVIAVRYAPNVE